MEILVNIVVFASRGNCLKKKCYFKYSRSSRGLVLYEDENSCYLCNHTRCFMIISFWITLQVLQTSWP